MVSNLHGRSQTYRRVSRWELHVDRRGRSVNVSMEKGQGRLDDGPTRINMTAGHLFRCAITGTMRHRSDLSRELTTPRVRQALGMKRAARKPPPPQPTYNGTPIAAECDVGFVMPTTPSKPAKGLTPRRLYHNEAVN
jgi:hypothetical protein